MRLLFFVLLLVSVMLFAWQQGLLGSGVPAGHEPERILRQIAPDRVRALSAQEVAQLRAQAQQKKNADADEALGEPLAKDGACWTLGDFEPEVVGRVAPLLGAMGLGERLSTQTIERRGWTMVFIPPLQSGEAAQARAEAIRALGVKEILVILDENSPIRYGIALGSFRNPELAEQHKTDLLKLGVADVRMSDDVPVQTWVRYRIAQPTDEELARLSELRKVFSSSKLRPC
ncbi:MAG TPA: hypothetical protein PLQ67_05055 [Burkholderiaceae bacterium]|nr:hypothetical protein [Burkholderiaceae bacterium]